ncbi:SWF or SNF family helicase, partial [Streptomyces sp. NPDC002130]
TETPPASGLDPVALEFLAARTAVRAHSLLREALRGGFPAELPPAQDAVRLAAGDPGRDLADRLADGSGRGREGLAAAVRAWRHGGTAALSVLDEEWRVEGETLARARAALDSAWDTGERPELRARNNRWTVVGAPVQLRLGRDGRWWPYRRESGRWQPAGGAAQDPATALASVTTPASVEPAPGEGNSP